jgi:hypothetical protein
LSDDETLIISPLGQLDHLVGLDVLAFAFEKESLWVLTDIGDPRLVQMDSDGAVLSEWSLEFPSPTHLVFDGTHLLTFGHPLYYLVFAVDTAAGQPRHVYRLPDVEEGNFSGMSYFDGLLWSLERDHVGGDLFVQSVALR